MQSISTSTQNALQRLVDQCYPAERLKPANAAERQSAYAIVRSTPANEPALIIAAYTDRSAGAVRVLRPGGTGALEVVYDNPDAWLLPGGRCTIRLHDVDFDGHPEAFIYFQGVR